jgi:ribosomal protein L20
MTKKRLGHDPLSEPRGMDGLIRTTQDTQKVQGTQKTQPKREKLPRINMAFAPAHLEYMRTMSGLDGISITAYVNRLVAADMKNRQAAYKKIKELQKGGEA